MKEKLDAEEMARDGFMTPKQASDFLQIGRTTLYLLMEKGDLPYSKIRGSRRLPRRSIIEFAANHLVKRSEVCQAPA